MTTTADSLARIDLLTLGCLIGAGLLLFGVAVCVIAELLAWRAQSRKDRP